MATLYQPLVGEWFQTPGGDAFEVVAYDPDEQTIEVQYFDGAIEEFDLDTWDELPIAPADPPEDWSGPMDLAREDFEMNYEGPLPHEGRDYLNEVDGLS